MTRSLDSERDSNIVAAADTATTPATDRAPSTAEVLAVLRQDPAPSGLFRGFGPLVLAGMLIVALALLVPSIAPEHIVERPAGSTAPSPDNAEPTP